MLNSSITAASDQVNFSRKSVVFLTPMIWLDEENPLASPPPFDFCTNTAKIIRIDASKMRIVMKIYMMCSYLFFIFLVNNQIFQKTNLVGKVSTFFWKIQA